MTFRTLTAAALLVALAAPALADENVTLPNGPPLVTRAGAAMLIQTPIPIGNVFIGDPAVADVQIPTGGDKNLIYVFGKKYGRTTIFALGEDGQVAMSRVVEVSGPKTVRVLRGRDEQVWSEAHGEPTKAGSSLSDLPAGSSVTVPVGSK